MTASLYQRGSSLGSLPMQSNRSHDQAQRIKKHKIEHRGSNKVVEVALGRSMRRLEAKHARRALGRGQRYEGARALPVVAPAGDELVGVIRALRVERPLVERHVDETALRVHRVEVHNDEHDIAAVLARFRVTDELIVVD